MRGRLISIEGGDGGGKTTQVKRLAEALSINGREVVATREPGGTAGAEAIRRLIVQDEADARWDAWSEALLIYAARRDHVEKVIRPALARGAWVVTDRFVHSTLAYQGLAGQVGLEAIMSLHRLVLGQFWPDLTIVLRLPGALGLQRARTRGGGEQVFESRGDSFQQRLVEAFDELALWDRKTVVRVDAEPEADEVFQATMRVVRDRLPDAFPPGSTAFV